MAEQEPVMAEPETMAEQDTVMAEQETVMAKPGKISCNIVFCDADEEIARTFKDELNKQDLECQDHREDGDPGKTICGNSAEGIILCDKTLVLLSANYLSACKKKKLRKWEHDLAVTKDCTKAHHKYVKIDGVCDKAKDYPKQFDGCVFELVYDPQVKKEFWNKLADFVKKDGVSWGDPAHGNAWSYYDGYLKIVFKVEPDFKRRVEDWKKANLPADARVCEKLLVLCPKNTAPLVLNKCANITAQKPVIENGNHNVAGNYRSYDVTMYSVTGKNAEGENVTIYLPMTVNLTLVHMYKMCEDKDKFFKVDKTQMQTQGIIFIHILKQILQQMKRSEQVQILTLEDNTDNLADQIVRSVKFSEER